MANSLVFPQHGDEPDAAFLATLAGDTRAPGALVNGFAFTVDYGTPALDVTAGKAFVTRSSMTTASSDVDPAESVDDAREAVQYPGETGVGLTDGVTNEIYLHAQFGTDDSPTVVANPSAMEDDMLKLGEVDTTGDMKSERWYPLADDRTLTFPDRAAIDAVAGTLANGTALYDRAAGVRYFTPDGGTSLIASGWSI